jgi:hypothetical protein
LRDRSTANLQAALREVGAIIVALPPAQWLAHIDRVTKALGVPPGTIHQAVLDTEPITATPRSTAISPQRTSRLTPPFENGYWAGHTRQPSHGTSPDLRHSR